MKNKGFTLVELLAVVGLIAAFALVTVPTVDSILKRQRQNLYNTHKKNVTDALKTWGNMNIELLPEEEHDFITVTLSDLKTAGLINDDMANPKTKKCYANSNSFTITKEKGSYIYTVDDLVDGSESDCG